MNDKNFNQGIEEIRNLRMTDTEKRAIFERVVSQGVPQRSNFVWVYFSRHSVSTLAAFLVVVLAGGSLVYAEGSLPGDILYPVKVAVTEPVRDILATNSGSEAKWQVQKAERRLEEAEALATEGRLDSDKEKKLETLLDKHTERLSTALNDLENTDEADDADSVKKDGEEKKNEVENKPNKNRKEAEEVRNNFKERMNKHAQTLEARVAAPVESLQDHVASTSEERVVGSDLAKSAREKAKAIEKQVRKEGRGNGR